MERSYHSEDDVDRDVEGLDWDSTLFARSDVPTKRENQARNGKALRNAHNFQRMMQDPTKVRRTHKRGSFSTDDLPEV